MHVGRNKINSLNKYPVHGLKKIIKRQKTKIFVQQRYDIMLLYSNTRLFYKMSLQDILTGLPAAKPDLVNFDWSGYIYQPVHRIGVQNVEKCLQVISVCRKTKNLNNMALFDAKCLYPSNMWCINMSAEQLGIRFLM